MARRLRANVFEALGHQTLGHRPHANRPHTDRPLASRLGEEQMVGQ